MLGVPVDDGQISDELAAQPPLLQDALAALVHGVLPPAPRPEPADALQEVLAQVQLGAGVLEPAAAVRSRAFVVMNAHLRRRRSRRRKTTGTGQAFIRGNCCTSSSATCCYTSLYFERHLLPSSCS